MSKIATTLDITVWRCDACELLADSPNAFTVPPGWWVVNVERRTDLDEDGRGNKLKRGTIDACSKQCVLEALQYHATQLIDYVT